MSLRQYPCILADRSQHALFSAFCISSSGTMLVSLWHSYCQFIPGSVVQTTMSLTAATSCYSSSVDELSTLSSLLACSFYQQQKLRSECMR